MLQAPLLKNTNWTVPKVAPAFNIWLLTKPEIELAFPLLKVEPVVEFKELYVCDAVSVISKLSISVLENPALTKAVFKAVLKSVFRRNGLSKIVSVIVAIAMVYHL